MARTIARTVDAPPRVWSTTRQAAMWLGWTPTRFEAVALLERDWLSPTYAAAGGQGKGWYWFDLVCLAWLYRMRGGRPHSASEPEKSAEKSAEKTGGKPGSNRGRTGVEPEGEPEDTT